MDFADSRLASTFYCFIAYFILAKKNDSFLNLLVFAYYNRAHKQYCIILNCYCNI